MNFKIYKIALMNNKNQNSINTHKRKLRNIIGYNKNKRTNNNHMKIIIIMSNSMSNKTKIMI